MTLKYQHSLEIDGQEVNLNIEAFYSPYIAGTYWQPPEDEMIEISTILGDNGKDYTNHEFTEEEMEILEQAGFKAAAEFYENRNAEREERSPFSEFV